MKPVFSMSMNFFQSIVLGIVQGATEFFPVSSSGHLVIIEHFFKNFYRSGISFEITLHLATLVAICIYYRRELKNMFWGICRWNSPSVPRPYLQGRKLFLMIVVGSVPTALIGLSLKNIFERVFSEPYLVLGALVLTGVILWLADRRKSPGRTVEEMTVWDALLIGLFQGLAITPGISRSGATISMGLFCGLGYQTCASYSFLLSIPAILGAAILESKDFLSLMNPQVNLLAILAGSLAATITGYLSIKYLVKILSRKKLSIFAWYCWFIAITAGGLIYFKGM
ncbi:MAG: undecaprenyl-diphosphate phosphatase [bacterium]